MIDIEECARGSTDKRLIVAQQELTPGVAMLIISGIKVAKMRTVMVQNKT